LRQKPDFRKRKVCAYHTRCYRQKSPLYVLFAVDFIRPVTMDHVIWRDSSVVLAKRKPWIDITWEYGMFAGDADEFQETKPRSFVLLMFKRAPVARPYS
jgi:hypothetical protein